MKKSLYARVAAVCLAAVLAFTLAVPGLAVAAPALQPAMQISASPLAPKAVNVTRGSIGLKYVAVAKAHRYEVQYSLRADFHGTKKATKYKTWNLRGLEDATTYYIRFRALNREGASISGWSGTLKARTLAFFPGEFTSIKVKRGQDKITVSWNKTTHTTHYSVKVADNLAMTRNVRTFRNIKGTSYTVDNLSNGSRSAMPNFIRFYAHNKEAKTRKSKRYTVYAAAPKVAGTEKLSVASYNLLCALCKGDPGVNPPAWTTRVNTIMKTISAKKPDILLLQEASNYKVPGTKRTQSMVDFRKRLKKAGYAMDRSPEKLGSSHYSNRIGYNSKKYKLVKKGTFALPTAKGANKRGAAWALLKSRKTGKQFYALSFHVDPKIPLSGKGSKAETMQTIDRKLGARNKKHLPVLIAGDMNSDYYQLPSNTPHETMMDLGWTDAASSASKKNYRYSTFNGYHKKQETSWSRIDYIFTKNVHGTLSYENVVDVDKKGRLRSVPGSDHNMVLARVKLP
ncbi:endonuclease/exonuclease/phosphatase family protein [Arthrobacter sp. NPDC089319]|uniref:endonuclease/exonuclease/phosphatase family protein n=1 Tax=Arthrobacter sp. NPDC089319 TaxID=3155915 RepID=UPI003424344A